MVSLTPAGIPPVNPHPDLLSPPVGLASVPAYSAPTPTAGAPMDPDELLPMHVVPPSGRVDNEPLDLSMIPETYNREKVNQATKRIATIAEQIKNRVSAKSSSHESASTVSPAVVIVGHSHHHQHHHRTHHHRTHHHASQHTSHKHSTSNEKKQAEVAGRVVATAAGGALLVGALYFIGKDIQNLTTAAKGLTATAKLSLILRKNDKEHTPRDQILENAATIKNKSIRLFVPMLFSALTGLALKTLLVGGGALLVAGGITGMLPLLIAGGVVTVVALGALALQWGIEHNQKNNQAKRAEVIYNLTT